MYTQVYDNQIDNAHCIDTSHTFYDVSLVNIQSDLRHVGHVLPGL